MTLNPEKVLLVAAGAVAASTVAFPYVPGYGTDLFQIVAYVAVVIAGRSTSFELADRHHGVIWLIAALLNAVLF